MRKKGQKMEEQGGAAIKLVEAWGGWGVPFFVE